MTKKLYTSMAERVLGTLWNQGDLTQKQLKKMYGVGCPSKEIQRLREQGAPIYSVVTRDKRGKRIVKYRLRYRPIFDLDKQIVATAYRANPQIFILRED